MTLAAEKPDRGQENAAAWLGSIEEMLDSLCDYEASAREEGWDGPHKDAFGATYFKAADGATWACPNWRKLCDDQDIQAERSEEGERAIHESVLSVMVRDGWRQPGVPSDEGPEEYEILLSTGGPALRIFGRLNEHDEPQRAELQHQDWGTPWTRFPAPEATLLAFASCFYFGS